MHEQNKDNMNNMKNTKAGFAHRDELQLRDLNNYKMQNNTHYNSTPHISTELTSAPLSNMNKLTNSTGSGVRLIFSLS